MAWSTPPMFVNGVALTYSQLNVLSANLNETAVGKATAAGSYYVSSAPNALVERSIQQAFLQTSDTTTSTTYDDLSTTVGPSVTTNTGPGALVFFGCDVGNNTVNAGSIATMQVSGATTTLTTGLDSAVSHTSATANAGVQAANAVYLSCTTGSNTFTMKYRVTSGTGTFQRRRVIVMAF